MVTMAIKFAATYVELWIPSLMEIMLREETVSAGTKQIWYYGGLMLLCAVGCLVLNIKNKRTELVLAIPGIIILVGLWLGTPVYTEFRYAYPMILSIPLVLCTTLYHKDQN